MFNFRREREPEEYVPYVGHVSNGIVALDNDSLLAMLRIDGVAWEMAETGEINARHAGLNNLLRNLANDKLVLTTHLVRTMDAGDGYPVAECSSVFARSLDQAYRDRITQGRLYRNELYLSLLLQKGKERALEDMVGTVMASLADYGPVRLGLRGSHVLFSEIGEAMRLLLTGEREPVPLVSGRLGGAIYGDRVIVGGEAVEIRLPGHSMFAAGFGMREYPASTSPGMLGCLLSAPYCCVLTQTFAFLDKNTATTQLTRKQNRMRGAGDKAAAQADELTVAAELVNGNRLSMGTHHLTLVVFADTLEGLSKIAPIARRHLAESGAAIVREDRALEAVYWGQLPGNLALRSRPGAITSRNFAALSPFHGYPSGHASGHWGGPVSLFRTAGGTPYQFHFHTGDVGNIFMTGPVGAGKTLTLSFMLTQAERYKATTVLFDKDRGAEILIRAMGGSYLVMPSGSPTGLAPLRALTGSPRDITFLTQLVEGLVSPGVRLKADMKERLEQGVTTMMMLPPEKRSFGELRSFLGQSDPDGMGARLETWCAGGPLGWVLDNDEDTVLMNGKALGFDVTAVLDDATTRGPIMAYLFHRVEGLVDGRRLILAIDEFWKALHDPGFRDVVNNKLKTIRKQNGVVFLVTQSPRDALNSPISHSIIDQCKTQIIMPNGRATEEDYIKGLKLTPAEFAAVKEHMPGSRMFLLKQDGASVACEMDLTGMGPFIAVLSGRTSSVARMERLREEHGEDWLVPFMAGWRETLA